VASELSASSGFGGFEFDEEGRSVVLSEWDFVLRIRATDGRSIAENIVNPPTGAVATINPRASLSANAASNAKYIPISSYQQGEDFTTIDPATVKLPALWWYEKEETAESESSSGGGSLSWLMLFSVILLSNRKRQLQ